MLGFVNCYYALSGVAFTAYETNGKFIVERGDDSAKDGSVIKTVVLEIERDWNIPERKSTTSQQADEVSNKTRPPTLHVGGLL